MLYGDSYLSVRYDDVRQTFLESAKSGLMTVFANEGHWDTSNVFFRDGKIVAYDKRNPGPEMRHIDYGLGVLSAEVLKRWAEDEPFDLADVYQSLTAENQLAGYEVSERFYEIGSPQGLAELDALLRTRQAVVTP